VSLAVGSVASTPVVPGGPRSDAFLLASGAKAGHVSHRI
jgi:hypothetical protein